MSKQPKDGYATGGKMQAYLTHDGTPIITLRRLQQLTVDGTLPERNADKHYHILGVFRGLIRYYQQLAEKRIREEATDEKKENLQVKTARERIKLLKEQKEVVLVTHVQEAFGRIVGSTRDNLRGVGVKVAQTVAGRIMEASRKGDLTEEAIRAEVRPIIDAQIDEQLRILANSAPLGVQMPEIKPKQRKRKK